MTWNRTEGKPFPYEEQDLIAVGWGGDNNDLVVWWLDTECRADAPTYLCVGRRARDLVVPAEKRFTVDAGLVAEHLADAPSVSADQVLPSLETLGCATVVANGVCKALRVIAPAEVQCKSRPVPSPEAIGARTCAIGGKRGLTYVRLP